MQALNQLLEQSEQGIEVGKIFLNFDMTWINYYLDIQRRDLSQRCFNALGRLRKFRKNMRKDVGKTECKKKQYLLRTIFDSFDLHVWVRKCTLEVPLKLVEAVPASVHDIGLHDERALDHFWVVKRFGDLKL